MTTTLYGSRGSGSAAIEAALLRCGIDYRVVRAATWEEDSALAELRSVNPLGQVPTLQLDDGSVLTESAAILIHLGLVHPQSGLLPADPAVRAQAIRGLVYIAANCYAAIGVIDYPERWCEGDDKPTLDRIVAGTRARLHGCWDRFADQFAADPGADGFLLGSAAPGALDYLAAVVSRWSGARKHLAQSRPTFFAVLERIDAHPAAAAVFCRHWPG